MQEKTLILGQMVLDTVINRNVLEKDRESVYDTITLGGPPSFSGIVGCTLAKIFPWIKNPLIYAYTCPKAITLLRKLKDFKIFSENLKERPKCPHFRLEYSKNDSERNLYLNNPPFQFNPTDFNWNLNHSPIAVVGSVYHEFNNPNIFSFLRDKCSFIAFDPQGCFRQISSNGKIVFRNWWNPKIVAKIDCIKISEKESKFLNLGTNAIQTTYKILESAINIVLLTRGKKGAILGMRKNDSKTIHVYDVPAYTEGTVIDETGAGDVFLFSFITHFHVHNDELEAVAFATSVASLLLENRAFWGRFSKEEIIFRQQRVKSQITEL
ncbi:MAG: PfkB family carbohydrate kinase [Candidatus Hermodarchaeota archaeon]